MRSSLLTRPGFRWMLCALVFGVMLMVALAPWWHNRAYVRDFFDYGVIIGGTGRLEQGERPYVDFITPIQTSWYAFNWAAERIAGGTFQAMTWSAAASILLAMGALVAMLARRWPWWAAVTVTAAITCASVSQHTIFWYNPWGVVLLAVVAWSGAVAPVWNWKNLGWNCLMAVGLFLGGTNKINFQLLALSLAWGWSVRALLTGRAGLWRVLWTWLGLGVFGLVLPIAAEMVWTGASFKAWKYNVVDQMAADRAGMMLAALDWRFYLKPCHDYYGQLRLPQIGLTGVVLSVVTVIAILRHLTRRAARMEQVLCILCGVIAVAGGMLMFTTNMDIAYIALSGWLVLLIALWLGFDLAPRGAWFMGGLIIPCILIGGIAWESAWRGQRSQFGYSPAPRENYISAEKAGANFGYLKGTHVPPEVFSAFHEAGRWYDALPADRKTAILYGPGGELGPHFWPTPHNPLLPLYTFGGTQFGPKEYAALLDAVNGSRYKEILVSQVLDRWTPELTNILGIRFVKHSLGEVFQRYSRTENGGLSDTPIRALEFFGGTADSRAISTPGKFFKGLEGKDRWFIGTTHGRETMKLNLPTNRLNGQVVVSRLPTAGPEAMAADFSIFAERVPDERYPRWQKRVILPAGQNEITVDYSIDSSAMPTRFFVAISPESTGDIAAGWRLPSVFHSNYDPAEKPHWLYPLDKPVIGLDAAMLNQILPAERTWTPKTALLRGGRVIDGEVELESGGELWVKVDGMVTDFSGHASMVANHPVTEYPKLRGMWMKGARLELYTLHGANEGGLTAPFQSWSSEPGGWLIVALDPALGQPRMKLRIEHLVHNN